MKHCSLEECRFWCMTAYILWRAIKSLNFYQQCWAPLAWLSGSGLSHMLSQYGGMIHFTILTLKWSVPGISTSRMSKWFSISHRFFMELSLYQTLHTLVRVWCHGYNRRNLWKGEKKIFWKVQNRLRVKYPQRARAYCWFLRLKDWSMQNHS